MKESTLNCLLLVLFNIIQSKAYIHRNTFSEIMFHGQYMFMIHNEMSTFIRRFINLSTETSTKELNIYIYIYIYNIYNIYIIYMCVYIYMYIYDTKFTQEKKFTITGYLKSTNFCTKRFLIFYEKICGY